MTVKEDVIYGSFKASKILCITILKYKLHTLKICSTGNTNQKWKSKKVVFLIDTYFVLVTACQWNLLMFLTATEKHKNLMGEQFGYFKIFCSLIIFHIPLCFEDTDNSIDKKKLYFGYVKTTLLQVISRMFIRIGDTSVQKQGKQPIAKKKLDVLCTYSWHFTSVVLPYWPSNQYWYFTII